jgi:hypothetical protein
MLGDSATYMRFLLLPPITLGTAFGAYSVALTKKVGRPVLVPIKPLAMTVECHFAMPGKVK